MKFSYNTKLTLPKQSKRSRSVLQDGSRSLGLFWKKKKTPSYNRRNTVVLLLYDYRIVDNILLLLLILAQGHRLRNKCDVYVKVFCEVFLFVYISDSFNL